MGWEAVDGAGARVSGDDVKIYVEKKNFIFSYSYLVYFVQYSYSYRLPYNYNCCIHIILYILYHQYSIIPCIFLIFLSKLYHHIILYCVHSIKHYCIL